MAMNAGKHDSSISYLEQMLDEDDIAVAPAFIVVVSTSNSV
jgi:hypothetical protein